MKDNQDKIGRLLSIDEVAGILHCHKNTLRNWDKNGFLKAIRIGSRGDRRYKESDVLKVMENEITG